MCLQSWNYSRCICVWLFPAVTSAGHVVVVVVFPRWPLWSKPGWWSTGRPWSATNHRGTRSTFSAWWSRTRLLPSRTSTFLLRRSNDSAKIYKTRLTTSSCTSPSPLDGWIVCRECTGKIFLFFSLSFLQSHIFKSIFEEKKDLQIYPYIMYCSFSMDWLGPKLCKSASVCFSYSAVDPRLV